MKKTKDPKYWQEDVERCSGSLPSVRVNCMVSQGNTVVVEITATGTHKGEILGIPATGKKVETKEIWIFDFEAGKVKLWKEYYNSPNFAGVQLNSFYVLEFFDKSTFLFFARALLTFVVQVVLGSHLCTVYGYLVVTFYP